MAQKDLSLNLRFKIPFFTSTIITPITIIIPFLLVYFGYFFSGGSAIKNINNENFIPFLLLGTMTSIVLHNGFHNFPNKFLTEKYWQTIEGIMLAPISKISLIIGGTIEGFVAVFPAIIIVFVTANFFLPTSSLQTMIVIIITLALLLIVSLSLGLIASLATLFNENYTPLFYYSLAGITFLSCFYYPIEFFDSHPVLSLLKPLIQINPYYLGVTLMRESWFNSAFQWNSFLYILIMAIALPFISVYIFRKAWQTFTIQGY